jgi:hypothetical protein
LETRLPPFLYKILRLQLRGRVELKRRERTQFESKTTWHNGKTERIDVENPNPGQRDGQILYHDPNNTKWYLDVENKEFYNQKTGEKAPSKIQKLLKDKDVQKAIDKGLTFLGEDNIIEFWECNKIWSITTEICLI